MPGTQRTEVRVAYDDAAIYIGARMYDSSPDSIMPILSRRDQYSVADWFGVFIDGYHDQRTGNLFALSAGGAVIDGVMYNDDWNDFHGTAYGRGKRISMTKVGPRRSAFRIRSFGLKMRKILSGGLIFSAISAAGTKPIIWLTRRETRAAMYRGLLI